MITKDYYDIVIVGAGPSGSTAARFAAQNGAKVLLLEKDREIGVPVRCAEGVGAKGLLRILGKVEPNWIASTITGFRLVSPDGTAVDARWGDCGYCLDRKVFDYELANMAAREGTEVVTKAYVNGLIKDDNGRVLGVKLKYMGNDIEVNAGITPSNNAIIVVAVQ